MRIFILALFLIAPTLTLADIYQQVENGVTTFSDTPLNQNSKVMQDEKLENRSEPTDTSDKKKSAEPKHEALPTEPATQQNSGLNYIPTPNSTDEKPYRLPDYNPEQQSTESSAATKTEVTSTAPQEIKKPYITFLINAPKDQENIHNQPSIVVDISLQPELQKGDFIQVYLDGKAQGEPKALTQFTIENVDRGTHQINAAIVSGGSVIKQSNSVTVYVHRASVNNKS